MLRRQRVELQINHERWLISYADFMTLLFAFFVVMYAVSQMHENKYRELSDTLTEMFSAPTDEVSEQKRQLESPLSPIVSLSEQEDGGSQAEVVETKELAALPTLVDQIAERFSDLIGEEAIEVSSNEQWLQVTLNNRILFPLGSVKPSRQAEVIFEEIASLLAGFDNPIQVEGFTDNLAINTPQFPSNWELSSARASAIVKLLMTNGVPPVNLSAIGYGEFQPIADNSTPAGRAENRRVVLMIGKQKRQRPEWRVSNNNRTGQNTVTGSTSIDNQDSPSLNTPESQASEGISPVTLDNGELLFTSDPELPRIIPPSKQP